MTADQWGGLVGGLVGAGIGVAGALWGTLHSIGKAEGPRERTFVKRAAAWAWVICIVFVAGLLLIPKPWGWLMWIVYGPLMVWGIRAMNAGQVRARLADESAREEECAEPRASAEA